METPAHKRMKEMNPAVELHIETPVHIEEGLVLPFSLRKNMERLADPRPILEVPLEILFRTLSYLDPVDLLHVARSTKEFRALLMSKNTRHVWRAARFNIGMPDPPLELSEPAFADLAFSLYCHNCLAPTEQSPRWAFRARYCSDCFKKLTIQASRDECVVDRHYSLKADRQRLKELSKGLNWEAASKVREQQYSRKQQIEKHATLCEDWYEDWKERHEEEVDWAEDAYYKLILEKLGELGRDEDMKDIAEQRYLPLLRCPGARRATVLTESQWHLVRDEVVNVLDRRREYRRNKARAQVLTPRFRVLEEALIKLRRTADGRTFPAAYDFAMIPEVRAIIDVSGGGCINVTDFDALLPVLPSILDRWEKSFKTKLGDLIRDRVELPDDVNTTDLAVGWLFYCKECHCSVQYTATFNTSLATHWCVTHGYDWSTERALLSQQSAYTVAASVAFWEVPFKFSRLTYLTGTFDIVEALGQDPERATIAEMDELKTRLNCVSCCSEDRVKRVMTWRSAVRHWYAPIHSQEKPKFEILSDADAAIAQDLETTLTENQVKKAEKSYSWSCGHCFTCDAFDISREGVRKHLKTRHNIEPSCSHDIVWSRAGDEVEYPCVFLIPDALEHKQIPCRIREALARGEAKIVPTEIPRSST